MLDPDTDKDGIWIPLPDLGMEFKVRSFDYPAYVAARNQLVQRLARTYKRTQNEARETEYSEGIGRLYAKHLLLDWKGFDEEYSAEAALEKLPDPAWKKFRQFVEIAIIEASDARLEFVEDVEKN